MYIPTQKFLFKLAKNHYSEISDLSIKELLILYYESILNYL